MIVAMKTPNEQHVALCHDFWPQSMYLQIPHVGEANVDDDKIGLDDNEGHYCGLAWNKPREEFKSQFDVAKGNSVLVWRGDTIYCVWLGVALCDVNMEKGVTNYRRVRM